MVLEIFEDLRTIFGVVKVEVADMSVKLNLTMTAVRNQTQTRGVVHFNKVKVPKPKPFVELETLKLWRTLSLTSSSTFEPQISWRKGQRSHSP